MASKSRPLLEGLARTLESDTEQREALIAKIKVQGGGEEEQCRPERQARHHAPPPTPRSPPQLARAPHGDQGVVVFKVDDTEWTLDLREGKGELHEGSPDDKPDLLLTINGARPAGGGGAASAAHPPGCCAPQTTTLSS